MGANKNTSAQKQALFLAQYKKTWGNISKACEAAGVSRTCFYQWREYDTKTPSPAAARFRQALADALEGAKDMAEAVVLTVAQGYTVPEVRPFMVPTTRVEMVKGKPVRTTTHAPVLVPVTKQVGPDAKAAVKFLEAKAKERGWGKALEVTHKGFPEIKTLVIKEVAPKTPQQ